MMLRRGIVQLSLPLRLLFLWLQTRPVLPSMGHQQDTSTAWQTKQQKTGKDSFPKPVNRFTALKRHLPEMNCNGHANNDFTSLFSSMFQFYVSWVCC